MLQCVSEDTHAPGQLQTMAHKFTTALQHNECQIFTKKEEQRSVDFPQQKKGVIIRILNFPAAKYTRSPANFSVNNARLEFGHTNFT